MGLFDEVEGAVERQGEQFAVREGEQLLEQEFGNGQPQRQTENYSQEQRQDSSYPENQQGQQDFSQQPQFDENTGDSQGYPNGSFGQTGGYNENNTGEQSNFEQPQGNQQYGEPDYNQPQGGDNGYGESYNDQA
ncbi:MAG: hypothetical protein ACQR33_06025 [Candidatus Saccharibacteria bacterium]